MSENSQATQKVSAKRNQRAYSQLFGSTPGDGEMQPKEGFSYSLCGFGQNLICTIIGSYLTVFMTDAIGFNALAVAFLMLGARILTLSTILSWVLSLTALVRSGANAVRI